MKNFKLISEFMGEDFNLIESISKIKESISRYGLIENQGGMDLVSGAYLFMILSKIKTDLFIESGIWRGFSSLIFDLASQNNGAQHYLFDPGCKDLNFMKQLKFKNQNGKYYGEDVGSSLFSSLGRDATFFFDDHQDQLERLLVAYLRGAKYVIFDDNYMFGSGGHHSIFDHFRDNKNKELFDLIVKNMYVAQPILNKNKGVQPLYESIEEIHNLEVVSCDNNYQWLTLIELNPLHTSLKSQGQISI
jgi:hypothetical protein